MKPRDLSTARLSLPLATAIAALLAAPSAYAADTTWSDAGASTAWLTTANWSTAASPSTNDVAIFANTGTATTAGINMGTVSGALSVQAIDISSTRTRALTIGNSSATSGTLTLTGNTIGGVANTILKNGSNSLLTIQDNETGTGKIMNVALGNATNNVIQITGTGGISISSIISGSSKNLTFFGTGSGILTLSGANTYTGTTTIGAGTLTVGNATALSTTSSVSLASASRLIVNATNTNLSKLSTANGGSGVVAGSFLRYSQAQTTAGAANDPGTIFGTVELNVTNVNPNYVLDFGSGGALTNLVASTYTSALTLSGTASIDSSASAATYSTGGITASTAGTKTLNLTGSNTGANLISSAIGDGSGAIAITKGGAGTWTLSGTNTFTGNIRVDVGILQFTKTASLYNSIDTNWTAAKIRVSNGGTLAVNVGGTGEFTTGNVTTLLGNLGGVNGTSTTGFAAESAIAFDTTNASGLTFTIADVIANSSGTGGGAIGLTKLGTNTLVLSNDNTYTGRTVISGGTLQLGSGGTTGKLSTSSGILNNGALTINRSDAVAQGTDFSSAPISGTGSFVQAGAGTTTLNAANTYSGTTTVTAGTLALTNALALQNSALNTTGAGFVTLTSGSSLTLGGLANSGTTRNLATIFTSGFTGTVTALTLNPLSGSVTYGGVIDNGAMSLTKTGAGTQILTGANLYTGATTINRGILTIGNGTTGSLNGITGTALTFTGTGTFNVAEAASSNQGMGALTLSAGDATITSTGIAAQTSTLTFASLSARTAGATANFTLATNTTAAQNQIKLTSTTNAPLNGSGSNNQGIFFGTTEYARYDTTNNRFRAVTYGTDNNASAIVATGTTLGINDATKDVKVSGNITAQTTASVNTLNLVATTMTLSSATEVLSVNGILATGGAIATTGSTINLAGKIQPAVAGGELVINTTGNFGLTAIIQDNTSASSLTKSGTAQLTLNNSRSTYTGGTVVNAGTVTFAPDQNANTDTFFGTGPVIFNAGTTLALNRTYIGNALTLNNATVTAGNSFSSTLAGTTTLTGISTFNITGNFTITGPMTGTGGLIKTGVTVVPVNGTNNYTGPTIISGGGLTFLKPASLYNADPLQWTKTNITVNNGGSLTVKIGGSGEFSIAQVSTIFGNLVSDVNSNGLQAGAFFGVDAGTSGGSFTFSTNLTDSTGVGGGAVGFRFFGNNSMGSSTLELTGTNTYSGQTIIDRQGLLKVSSINSVFTNADLGTVHSASSSLGAPTSVATGTIQLGTAASFQGSGLLYVGTGETTDRVLSLGGGGNDNYRLDQSGTGNLKFISNIVMSDTRGVKTIVLQGSTAGTGEMAGVIPNATSGTPTTVLTKAGTGTWTLSAANLYSGTTTIQAGKLVAGADSLGTGVSGAFGSSLGGAIVLGNGSTLVGDAPAALINGAFTVGRAITVGTGAATAFNATLGGSNTSGTSIFSGNITLAAGGTYTATLQAAPLGTVEFKTGTWATNNKAIRIGSTGNTGTVKISNAITTSGGISVNFGTLALDSAFTGNMTVSSGTTLSGIGSVSGTTGVTSGTVSGGTGFTLTGVTTFNNTGNTLSGTVTTNATLASGAALALNGALTGTLAIGNGTLTGASGSASGAATLNGGIINLTSGSLGGTLGVTGGSWNGAGSVTGLVTSSSGIFTIGSGANLTASGDLAVTGGTLAAIDGTSKITGSLNYTSSSDSSFAGEIAGSGKTVTINNASTTLTLSGTSSYTGATNVDAGKLVVNGNISSSSQITVASGASITGSGTVGAATINGVLAIGNSPGTMNLSSLSLGSGSTYLYEMTGGGTAADLGDIAGALTIDTATILDLVELGTYTIGNKFTLFAYDGLLTGNFSGLLDESTFTDDLLNSWMINYDDTTAGLNGGVSISNTYVTITAIPEPSAAILAGLGGLALLRRRRK